MNKKYADLGMLIIRLGVGLGFIYFHGWGKITGGPERWERLGSAMRHLGIDFAHTFFGFMAALAETVCALFFAAGFLFTPMSWLLAFTMLVATYSHISTGEGSPGNSMKYLFLFFGISFISPGKYSIDYLLKKK